jgi:hypothetical protein
MREHEREYRTADERSGAASEPTVSNENLQRVIFYSGSVRAFSTSRALTSQSSNNLASAMREMFFAMEEPKSFSSSRRQKIFCLPPRPARR